MIRNLGKCNRSCNRKQFFFKLSIVVKNVIKNRCVIVILIALAWFFIRLHISVINKSKRHLAKKNF